MLDDVAYRQSPATSGVEHYSHTCLESQDLATLLVYTPTDITASQQVVSEHQCRVKPQHLTGEQVDVAARPAFSNRRSVPSISPLPAPSNPCRHEAPNRTPPPQQRNRQSPNPPRRFVTSVFSASPTRSPRMPLHRLSERSAAEPRTCPEPVLSLPKEGISPSGPARTQTPCLVPSAGHQPSQTH